MSTLIYLQLTLIVVIDCHLFLSYVPWVGHFVVALRKEVNTVALNTLLVSLCLSSLACEMTARMAYSP